MSKLPDNKLPRSAEKLIADFLSIPQDSSRGRSRPTVEAAGLMEQILIKHQIGRDAPEHLIREQWAQIVGNANASYSHPLEIDPRGRLMVLSSHAVVRNELFHHRASIVAKIRKLPGCTQVREIHVRAG